MTTQLPSAAQAKELARRLRAQLAEDGKSVGYAQSLELVAHRHGFRNWNAMVAAIGARPPSGWAVGDTVRGTYLSQPFTATLIALTTIRPGWFRVELDLDEPVDVVTFDSFSNLRKRVVGIVGPKGHSLERTSLGEPHLRLDLW